MPFAGVRPSVVFVDAVDVVTDYLRPLLDPTPVGGRVPNPRPDSFVRVARVGGTVDTIGVVDRATLIVEAWASTAAAAHDLCQTCRRSLAALPGTDVAARTVYRVTEVSGPANLPDEASQHDRYTMTMQVWTRGRQL